MLVERKNLRGDRAKDGGGVGPLSISIIVSSVSPKPGQPASQTSQSKHTRTQQAQAQTYKTSVGLPRLACLQLLSVSQRHLSPPAHMTDYLNHCSKLQLVCLIIPL